MPMRLVAGQSSLTAPLYQPAHWNLAATPEKPVNYHTNKIELAYGTS